jgi:S1-C subfamily serine protease
MHIHKQKFLNLQIRYWQNIKINKVFMKHFTLIFLCLMFFFNLKSQSIRNINLNQYKYIVIDEISGNYPEEARKDVVKILQKAGYNVVNLSKPLKTYEDYPADLEENKNLGLFLSLNRVTSYTHFLVSITIQNNNNKLILERSGSSISSTGSVKMALNSLINYNYKYDGTLNPIESNEDKIEIPNSNNWQGNGTGFFIDLKGYIATNYHVVENVSEIEVEFNRNGSKQIYQAKVIKSDKQNDIAIIKINSDDFIPFDTLPYFFKIDLADVGSSVFTLGFPMALSLMGEDIKFTDGKISSKTGFLGNITNYQISVPIQPGNSGGPLFDFDGNLIGITSSTVNRQLDLTENVNYAIKSSYLVNLIDVLDIKLQLPNNLSLATKSLTDKIKILSDFVVLIKTK